LLLRPRKVVHKNFSKKRKVSLYNKYNIYSRYNKYNIYSRYIPTFKLKYGHSGLLNKSHTFMFFNKFLFKIKLFLKKTVRRSNITNRLLWLNIFPHIPVTKKVIGSRMGKGKGKPSNWAAKIPNNSVFIELKNVRPGRSNHFLRQVSYKLPGYFLIISKYKKPYTFHLKICGSISQYVPFS
jgi:large subunit ribosomal protein L16